MSIANYNQDSYNEDWERLPTAIRGIPRIADDRIPEITRRYFESATLTTDQRLTSRY